MKVELLKGKYGETAFTITPENEADKDAFKQWCHLMARPWEVTGYEYEKKESVLSA